MSKKAVTAKTYAALLTEISALYESSRQKAQRTLERILIQTCWETGRRIVVFEQGNHARAPYGDHLLEKLSTDLTKKYGKGFSLSNLFNMRLYYQKNPIFQAPGKLDWSKQCILLTVKDDAQRKLYEKEALKHHWSYRQLADVLKKDKVPLEESLKEDEPSDPSQPSVAATPLNPQKGRLNTYKVMKAQDGRLVVDCGFSIRREIPEKSLASFKDEDMVEVVPAAAPDAEPVFNKIKKDARLLYTYSGLVERVIDGDTLICEVFCGLGTRARLRLRLRGIDCPEAGTQKGEKAKQFVQKQLRANRRILLRTHLSDKYDRPLADIWLGEEETYLNQLLLDQGLAEKWESG
ncbi:MAG TPA: hypothetical protein DD723_08315 [Candidatus Omnitrophica bacterium]|nr:MAG: hypothetical protein A2Z81_08260 [Omnitrophica WOR_2 bacterium GWA2_45_18]HBR15526.1 hypothetical protein [Candidatus Omnitrophota bacterium]